MMFIAKLFARREKNSNSQTFINGERTSSLILPPVPLQSVPTQQPEWFVTIHGTAGVSPAPAASYRSRDTSRALTTAPPRWAPAGLPTLISEMLILYLHSNTLIWVQPPGLWACSPLCLAYSSTESSLASPLLLLLVAV